MLRVVVDVNVLVSGLLRPAGVPGLVLDAWRAGLYDPVVSPRLLAELRAVLGREKVAARLPSDAEDRLLVALETVGIVVPDPPPTERFVLADPDDDYLVALARAGQAQAVVTGDGDLLEAGLQPPAITPREFLERLERYAS